MSLKERRARIDKHIKNLKAIFPALKNIPDHRIEGTLAHAERRAHRNAERLCNDSSYGQERYDRDQQTILEEVDRLLKFRETKVPVVANGDARGYGLYIDNTYVRAKNLDIERTWGHDGIIWPNFEGE